MMYCLRSYIPLLLLPLPVSLSPIHLTTLLVLTYMLNRPCIYCSLLLVILFASSCHWSGKCLWEGETVSYACNSLSSNGSNCSGWKAAAGNASEPLSLASRWASYALPRLYTSSNRQLETISNGDGAAMAAFLTEVTNSTISGLATAAKESAGSLIDSVKQKVVSEAVVQDQTLLSASGNGIGVQWLKNLLGRSEWTLPCIGIKVVL